MEVLLSNIGDSFWGYRFWWIKTQGPSVVYDTYAVTNEHPDFSEILSEAFEDHFNSLTNIEMVRNLMDYEDE